MKLWLLSVLFCCFILTSQSQYFHESLDLYYNLRSSLVKDQKVKTGFRTYSNVNFENTIPNILDNFQLLSRFRFVNSSHWFVKNTEFGVGLTGFISAASQIPDQYQNPTMRIRVYDNHSHSNILTPGLQYIRNWHFNDTIDSRLQLGLALRYNIVGNPEIFSKSYPLGYDFSIQLNHKFFSMQFMHSANTIYNSFTFRSADVADVIETNRKRVSIPGEFENLTFLTLAFGNAYYKLPTDNDKLLHYFYFSMRRLYPSNKEYRIKLVLKNLDYIFGCRFRYKKLLINPEYSTNRSDIGYHAYKGKSYSFLLGYEFGKISVKLGYAHVVYYELAVDVSSLKNNDNITLDKMILAIDCSF